MEIKIEINVSIPLEDEQRIYAVIPELVDKIHYLVKWFFPGLQISRMNSPIVVRILFVDTGENIRP